MSALALVAVVEVTPLVAAAAGSIAAAGFLLSGRRASATPRADLLAAGWSPSKLAVTANLVSLVVAAALAVWFTQRQPADGGGGQLAEAALWSLVVLFFGPKLLATAIRSSALVRFARQRDAALLMWMRRIRMFVAAGRPTAAAVLEAAERVPDRAFRPTAGIINHAVSTGRDPLSAVASRLTGTPAATLLGTVEAAERSGASASNLIDDVLGRVVAAMDASRRERIDALGRAAVTAASINAVLAGLVVVVAVVTTLPAV